MKMISCDLHTSSAFSLLSATESLCVLVAQIQSVILCELNQYFLKLWSSDSLRLISYDCGTVLRLKPHPTNSQVSKNLLPTKLYLVHPDDPAILSNTIGSQHNHFDILAGFVHVVALG